MNFTYLSEFEKDLKRLLKRYISLNEDLIKIMSILEVYPNARPPFSFLLYNKSNTIEFIELYHKNEKANEDQKRFLHLMK